MVRGGMKMTVSKANLIAVCKWGCAVVWRMSSGRMHSGRLWSVGVRRCEVKRCGVLCEV